MPRRDPVARLALLFLPLALSGAGCAEHDPRIAETTNPTPGATITPKVLGGTPSDESQDSVVMLVSVKPEPNIPLGICTATLIAPRLIVTARHCVAHANESVACLADGTPQSGGEIRGNHDVKDMFVFTGKDRPNLDPNTWKPASGALEIIDDASGNLCNHDIALVVLKDAITNVPISPIRLDGDVGVGESMLTVGWGISSSEIEPSKRQQRGGVVVKRVGPNDGFPTLTKTEILFGESICLGDSGGPIFAEQTKAVVAVVSRGGNGADFDINHPASTCNEADNLGTRIAPFKDVVLRAFDRAGAQPKLEEKPDDDDCTVSRVGAKSHLDGHSPSSLTVGIGVILLVLTLKRRAGRSSETQRSR